MSGGDKVFPERVEEAIEIHRRFLVEVYHKELDLLNRSLSGLPGQPFASALEHCRRQEEAAERASEVFHKAFKGFKAGDRAAAKELAAALVQEADRWMEHRRWEDENLYRRLRRGLPKEVRAELAEGHKKIHAEGAGVEVKLTSWTARWGPSSD
jgi:hemerythrin-like domain-containing protein